MVAAWAMTLPGAHNAINAAYFTYHEKETPPAAAA